MGQPVSNPVFQISRNYMSNEKFYLFILAVTTKLNHDLLKHWTFGFLNVFQLELQGVNLQQHVPNRLCKVKNNIFEQ